MTMDPSISLPLLLGLSRSTATILETNTDIPRLPFIERLHYLLTHHPQVISWQVHGRAFRILDQTNFVKLMNKYDHEWDFYKDFESNGFKIISGGKDEGCWWKDGFTKCRVDDVLVVNDADVKSKKKKKAEEEEDREEVSQFLVVTASTDKSLARRYLEMSGGNVEMAVTLFLESSGGFGFGRGSSAATVDAKTEEEMDAYKGSDEPDLYSLPFADEPPRQSPAVSMVTSALKEYWAYRTLRRALLRWIASRGSSTKSSNSPKTAVPPKSLQPTNKHHGTSHFLMRFLIHPSINVRRAAGRMFLHNLHQVQGIDKKDAILAMQESLIILLHNIMFDDAPYDCKFQQLQLMPTPSRNSLRQQANEGDPAIQLMGMLTSLVCDGGFSNIIVADFMKTFAHGSRRSPSGMWFNSQLQELASFSIESFVASGGLRWACGCIVRLVHLFVHGSIDTDCDYEYGNSNDSDSHNRKKRRWKNGGVNNEMIQTRLVLLINLVYRLVLFGSVPYAVDKERALASINGKNEEQNSCGKRNTSFKNATRDDPKKKKRRDQLSRFYELMYQTNQNTGETSRTTSLQNSIRASLESRGVISPPFPPISGKDKGSIGDGGEDKDKQVDPEVAEENRVRRERRKATLERVNDVFWKTTSPAAMSIGKSVIHDGSMETNKSYEAHYESFSPLACLLAAYEIIRSPSSRFNDATNKAVGILSRIVDPAAGYCLVVSDPEIPWGLTALLGTCGDSKRIDKADEIAHTKKHGTSMSHSSQENQRSISSTARLSTTSSPSHNDVENRVKRQRTRRTHISSLLERLTDTSNGIRDDMTGSPPYSTTASSLLLGRSKMSQSAISSANRDGSLSRIIASTDERLGFGEPSTTIRARAVLDRSPCDWRLIDSIAGRHDEAEDDGVVMMEDDDNDTEFEQDQEDVPRGGMEDLPDELDDEDGGDDDDEDEDGDEDEQGEHTDEGEENSIFDDAVILMDQVTDADDRELLRNNPHRQPSTKDIRISGPSLAIKHERERAFLRAGMEILRAQYLTGKSNAISKNRMSNACSIFSQPPAVFRSHLLTLSAEQSLIHSMCDIVKPPKKPINLKIFMRRAPTQEEFFRGALSRNPINISSLKFGSSSSDDSAEPTFSDLRKHIAKDLQMEDSAELLELIVASKIIDVDIKLRVAQQVLWKKYVLENSTSVSSMISGAGPGHQMISTGSGMSMIFSSCGLGGSLQASGTDELDVTQLPPMVVTYRLAGVDGEATEDKVEVKDLEDPEAVTITCPKALEEKMEKEFGITRVLADDGGISTILASVQLFIDDVTTRIRRDEIRLKRREHSINDENVMRVSFTKSAPCPGLLLLRHCANLTDNRKKLLAARAPTTLLRMLLDILNAMNRWPTRRGRLLTFDETSTINVDEAPRDTTNTRMSSESNPTTNMLQEIIEMLASDISAEVSDESSGIIPRSGSFINLTQSKENSDDSTLSLVLKSLRSANLSPPLRKVISKLLPFLTYGQINQSKELGSFFVRYIKLELLGISDSEHDLDMMSTFVDTAINLPPVGVCDNLRQALISNGFIDKVKSFILLHAPSQPPYWSSALYPKQISNEKISDVNKAKDGWKRYFDRPGLVEAIKILIGLCSKHHTTQITLSERQIGDETIDLPTLCHWIESTSDNHSSGIKTNGLGILAETLLDALKEGNDETSKKIESIRRKTRERKKEIAEERRNRALAGMSGFGKLVGCTIDDARSKSNLSRDKYGSELRSTPILASTFGVPTSGYSPPPSQTKTMASTKGSIPEGKAQPSWMAEMEAMEEESGVTCVVCQEGRTLQPSELLGMYAYMKKVTIPLSQGGDRTDIDGTVMLLSLPISCPRTLIGSQNETFFTKGKTAAKALRGTSHALGAMAIAASISGNSTSNRASFITSVSAGNAIHSSCHAKAKAADRSHPKAPKSEWEGASLRNSRVTCNVILPLVSSKISNVPLIAVESALDEVNSQHTTILGSRPKPMLWNILHDVRLLMLRMAYGEALNIDCGGGSASSNFLLALYQLYTADMLLTKTGLDDSQVAKHARGLSPGFIAASAIVNSVGFTRNDTRSKRLERGVANAAPMAALCSILFLDLTNEGVVDTSISCDVTERKTPSSNRQWETHKDTFLAGLLRCAGLRNALGITDSGCVTSRGISTESRKNIEKARSFTDWNTDGSSMKKKSTSSTILEGYAISLRPMITLYAILNSLSKEFVVNDTDENTLTASERLASTLESCLKTCSVVELLEVAEITMDHDAICKFYEKGLLI